MSRSKPIADSVLDARGLECPEPVVQVARALSGMVGGAVLVVKVDDPLAPLDLRVYCERSGHELLDVNETADGAVICIRHRSDDAHFSRRPARPEGAD